MRIYTLCSAAESTFIIQAYYQTTSDTSTKSTAQTINMSHASGDSKVPQAVQDKAPKGVEESLPDSVRIIAIVRLLDVYILMPTTGSPHRGQRRPWYLPRQGRRGCFHRPPEDPGGSAGEGGAHGAQRHPRHWRQGRSPPQLDGVL